MSKMRQLTSVLAFCVAMSLTLYSLFVRSGWVAPLAFLAVVLGSGFLGRILLPFTSEKPALKITMLAFILLMVAIASFVGTSAVRHAGSAVTVFVTLSWMVFIIL